MMSSGKRKAERKGNPESSRVCLEGMWRKSDGQHRNLLNFITKLDDGTFQCRGNSMACYRVYSSMSAMKRHVLRHFQKRACPHEWCRHSQISFRSTRELHQHMTNKHDIGLAGYPLWFLASFDLEDMISVANVHSNGSEDFVLNEKVHKNVMEKIESILVRIEEPMREVLKAYLLEVWNLLCTDQDNMGKFILAYNVYDKMFLSRRAHVAIDSLYDGGFPNQNSESLISSLKGKLVKPRLPKQEIVRVQENETIRDYFVQALLNEESRLIELWRQSLKTCKSTTCVNTCMESALFRGEPYTPCRHSWDRNQLEDQSNWTSGPVYYSIPYLSTACQRSDELMLSHTPIGPPCFVNIPGWVAAPSWTYGAQQAPDGRFLPV